MTSEPDRDTDYGDNPGAAMITGRADPTEAGRAPSAVDNYEEPCECGNAPSWELVHEETAMGRAAFGKVMMALFGLFGILVLTALIVAGAKGDIDNPLVVAFGLFFGGGALYAADALRRVKPPLRQVLRCGHCRRTVERLVPREPD